MFERFTDGARKSMALANQEAQRMGHTHIDTGHILLGLLKEGLDAGSGVLAQFGMEYRSARNEVERLAPPTNEDVLAWKLPQTQLAKQVILYAIEESRALDHRHVGTEHFVLAFARQSEGVASQILRHHGVSHAAVLAAVAQIPRPLPGAPNPELVWKYALIRQYRGYLQHLNARRGEAERLGQPEVADYHEQAANAFRTLLTQLEEGLPPLRGGGSGEMTENYPWS
jgi:ATP-dependent Clp protease ATP-binding subunit ClpA